MRNTLESSIAGRDVARCVSGRMVAFLKGKARMVPDSRGEVEADASREDGMDGGKPPSRGRRVPSLPRRTPDGDRD